MLLHDTPPGGWAARAQLRSAIFEYIEGFYNPIRLTARSGCAPRSSTKPTTPPTIPTASRARPRAKNLWTTFGCPQVLRLQQPDSTKAGEVQGTIYCFCGRRLMYGRHRGKTGVYYQYFSCTAKRNGEQCDGHHIDIDHVEDAVTRHYGDVVLTADECERVRQAVREQAETRSVVSKREADRHARTLAVLKTKQNKLLDLYYAGGADEELMVEQQARIEAERSAANRWLAAADLELSSVPPPMRRWP